MIGKATLLLLATAPTVWAQRPAQVMVGHPMPPRVQNPPTLPLRHVIEAPGHLQNRRNRAPTRNVVYVPAPLPYYAYAQPAAPSVNVQVTNVVELPQFVTPAAVWSGIGVSSATPLTGPWRVWDPYADLEAERAARVSRPTALDDAASERAAAADDIRSAEAIVAAYYDVLSGPRGAARNWARFHTLFAEGARIVAQGAERDGATRPVVVSADEYADVAGSVLDRGVFHREVARTVERFGAIASVFSTFELRRMSGDSVPFQRGVANFQLYTDGARWWITSVSWDAETDGKPLPAKYLPPKR